MYVRGNHKLKGQRYSNRDERLHRSLCASCSAQAVKYEFDHLSPDRFFYILFKSAKQKTTNAVGLLNI